MKENGQATLRPTNLFLDTAPEAEAVLFELLRQATPARKLQMVDQLNDCCQTGMVPRWG